ncbi:glycosyltransferase [Piscinibacter sakaiensis]|uniref:glycosyltransferase n=1 Tax=Piscinibacter sakaiensis TaxID=1547922 RepID=UPI003AB104A2
MTILREVVGVAARDFAHWRICVIVHRTGLLNVPGIEEIVYPQAKRSWLRRMWCEWVELGQISRRLQPDVWLSLHDMTPRVRARRRYVYCHNPAPFSSLPLRRRLLDRSFFLFSLFYGGLYRLNIHANSGVIVQQQWLREEFVRRYGVKRVIVAHPTVSVSPEASAVAPARRVPPQRFVFPCFPRIFKNIELLGQCAAILDREPRWTGRIIVTIDGSESSYARSLVDTYGGSHSIEFVGLQAPSAMVDLYARSDALLFPSLLETWGLPLTEAKQRGLPIVAADLPYARESIGNSDAVAFFDPHDATALAELLLGLSEGRITFGTARHADPDQPFARGWTELLNILLVDDEALGNDARATLPTATKLARR